jgi:hypothetical protein
VDFVPLIAAAGERGTKRTLGEQNVPRLERGRARGTKCTRPRHSLNAAVLTCRHAVVYIVDRVDREYDTVEFNPAGYGFWAVVRHPVTAA